jgi:hypothetical protein
MRFESASCAQRSGRITNDLPPERSACEVEGSREIEFRVFTTGLKAWARGLRALRCSLAFAPNGISLASLFYDLGVLDHGDATALGQFALERNCLAAVLSELVVHWLVFADDQISFAIADDPDRAAVLDAFRSAGLAMFFADRIVVDVAHHVDHFAGHFFRSSCVGTVLFLRDRQWRHCQSGGECSGNR